MSSASAITTGSNSTDEYAAALASTRVTPAEIIQPVASSFYPARTTHQAESARNSSERASPVASAPSSSTGPTTANSAAPKNAARRPNSRAAVDHNSTVTPSINATDTSRAPARPAK